MSAVVSVPAKSGYLITQKGIDALGDPLTCQCRPVLQGLLFICPECQTVYWRFVQRDFGV
jgi:hypothetical protein